MDTRTFDKLAVAMASGSSRRRVLGGLAAVLGVAVASPAVAQKGGNGKSKGGDKGNSGNAPGKNKVTVCHRTGNGKYNTLSLPAGKAKGHDKHAGDLFGIDIATNVNHCGACGKVCETPTANCKVASCVGGVCGEADTVCAEVECKIGACNTETGLCEYTNATADVSCAIGTCDGAGTCVPNTDSV